MLRPLRLVSLAVLLGLPVLVAVGAGRLATRWGEALGHGFAIGLPNHAPNGGLDEAAADGSSEGGPFLFGRTAMPSAEDMAGSDAAGTGASGTEHARGESRNRARGAGAARSKAAPSRGIYVGQARVLECVARRARPDGRPVRADANRPGGILLSGVAALGIGLEDGDILTEVEGRPVSNPGEVVGLVLAARARQASVISGRIFRRGLSFPLAVEQPYPGRTTAKASEEPTRSKAPAARSESKARKAPRAGDVRKAKAAAAKPKVTRSARRASVDRKQRAPSESAPRG